MDHQVTPALRAIPATTAPALPATTAPALPASSFPATTASPLPAPTAPAIPATPATSSDRAALSRRALFGGAFCVGMALAGCGSGSGDPVTPGSATSTPATPTALPGGPPGALVELAAVPVGGGVMAPGPVLVVRVGEEDVAAYNPICPHQAFTVGVPDGAGTITCPGHGARFTAADGALISGPAPSGLRRIAVQVKDGFVVRE
jgi:nitrite reductase/ring-hydroxylating ferredoxin subunit